MTLKKFLTLLVTLLLILTGLLFVFAYEQGALAFYVCEGALIVSIITLVMFYRLIMRPIKTLSQGMNMLASQDFNQKLNLVGQREVDSIAVIFNELLMQLRNEQIHTREQEHFLTLLINSSPTAIILFDGNNRVRMTNNAARSLIGFEPDNLKLDQIESPMAQIMQATPERQSVTLPTQDGRLFKCTHQTFMDSGFAHHFYIIDEVTEEINRAQRDAYEKVIRMISHEVNNTMTGIKSTLQIVGSVVSEVGELKDFSEPVNACVERSEQLSNFISRIAQVIKIPDPNLIVCDVTEILKMSAAFILPELEHRGITLRFVSSEQIMTGADREMLNQAFLNILRNAMESIGNDGEITIEASQNQIRITDTGQGISPETEQNLFRPFFTTKRGGHGIGLMLIAEILTKHNFKYSLKTDPATSLTTFAITV